MILPVLPEYANVVVKPRAKDYLVNGKRYQRVTTALGIINKPFFLGWGSRIVLERVAGVLLDPKVKAELVNAISETPSDYAAFVARVVKQAKKAPNEARNASGNFGTEVHRLVQEFISLPPDKTEQFLLSAPKEKRPAVSAAANFLADFGITVCDTERVVWSPGFGVAGTIDGVGFIGNDLVIWDWKTGSHIYWETALQLAAYADLLNQVTGVEVTKAYAVRLPRAGDAPEYEVETLGETELYQAWCAYVNALSLYRTSKLDLWSVLP